MEVHTRNSVAAKRLWNVLRITFFMVRKGFISKRKLIMDMNMMMKRGKILRKSLSNLMTHHHHNNNHSSMRKRGGFGIREYEFSCSNSPNPVFFHMSSTKRKHNYFPCINAPEVTEEEEVNDMKAVVFVPKTPEHMFNFRPDHELGSSSGEQKHSPFSVRVSNYSSESDENDGGNRQVDDEAEEFIRRFYEQLRAQSRVQLLQ